MNFLEGTVTAVRPWGVVVTLNDGSKITAKNALNSGMRRKQPVLVAVDDNGRMQAVSRPRV